MGKIIQITLKLDDVLHDFEKFNQNTHQTFNR